MKVRKVHHERERGDRERRESEIEREEFDYIHTRMHGKAKLKRFIRPFFSSIR
jgi:hypothetical protein